MSHCGPQEAMSEHRQQGLERARVIALLLEQNLSQAEIGRRLGTSRARVGQIVLAHGLIKPQTSTASRRATRPLTKRQALILAFIWNFTNHNPYPPTVREITRGCNLSSTSVADYNLLCLKEKGYLTRVPSISRGIVLTERGKREAAA